jgi:hypothetical protein
MGYPRAYLVDPEAPGFFHCVSRCVRRAWLCGDDPVSGLDFDHRRGWIEQRLIDLAQSFAVGLYAWAVMSNHVHVVLYVDPTVARNWSDEEIARRWARLSQSLDAPSEDEIHMRAAEILRNPGRIETLRQRLGSLSWFMRYLNECIAGTANREDRCRGRFWEGRFRCQALLDDVAVEGAMTYVDLNPIRAGLADELVDSDYTTVQQRLRALEAEPEAAAAPLASLAGPETVPELGLTVGRYIESVDWEGRQLRAGKSGRIPEHAPPALSRNRGSPSHWQICVTCIETAFASAVGAPDTLRRFAERTGRQRVKGVGLPS